MNANFREPDFNYPRQVISAGEAVLAQSDAEDPEAAGVSRLFGTLETIIARTRIDPDSAFYMPAFISAQAAKARTADAKAMLKCLEAVTYSKIYNEDRYKYDRVDAPMFPLPDDVSKWSGEQFRHVTDSLLTEALAYTGSESLWRYYPCIEIDDFLRPAFPTVADFISVRSAEVYDNISLSVKARDVMTAALGRAEAGSPAYFYWKWRLCGDAQSMLQTYLPYKDSEAARFLLMQCANETRRESGDGDNMWTVVVDELRRSLSRFPDWRGNESLSVSLKRLTLPDLNVQCPAYADASKALKLECRYLCTCRFEIKAYRLPSQAEVNRRTVKDYPCVATVPCTIEGDTVQGTREIKLALPSAGRYALVVNVEGVDYDDYCLVEMVPFMSFCLNSGKESVAVTTDFATGAPMKGVAVARVNTSSRNNSISNLGRTGSDGALLFRNNDSRWGSYLRFTLDGNAYNFNESVRARANRHSDNSGKRFLVLTDRGLYHPGDTISWAVVAAESEDGVRKVLGAKELKITLYDANRQKTDSVNVITDAYGRANGSFRTRKGVLTGEYSITVKSENTEYIGTSVTVSDFRMPVFEVKVDSVLRDTPVAGAVRICGEARTYSGMPVAGARVAMSLSRTLWWRWFGGGEHIDDYECLTDESGRFSIDIPADDLTDDEDNPWGMRTAFLAAVTVTDANAQTAYTQRAFTTGKPYALMFETASARHDTSEPLRFTVKASDIDGHTRKLAIRWAIGIPDSDGKISSAIASGNGTTDNAITVDLASAPAGMYGVSVISDDTALADTLIDKDALILYNVSRGLVPDTGAPVFIVNDKLITESGKASLQFGVRSPQWVYIAYPQSDGNLKLISREYDAGFHKVELDIDQETNVYVCAVHNGDIQRDAVSVTKKQKSIRIIVDSFRDRLTPGAAERWTFRFVDQDGKAVNDAAMVARMYNAALDALENSSLPSSLGFFSAPLDLDVSMPYLYNTNASVTGGAFAHGFRFSDDIDYRWMDLFMPVRYMKYMLMSRNAAGLAEMEMNDMAIGSAPEETPVLMEESADALAEEERGVSDTTEGTAHSETDFEYRPSEVLQAFFRPELRTDAEGNVTIEFTVPEANGAWTFQSFGWTPQGLAAGLDLSAVSSKKVMVQPNLPRFLRQGDTATLASTVYNNSGASADIRVVAEILDSSDNRVVASVDTVVTVADQASAIVPVQAEAPTDRATIVYRVRASIADASDGELTAVPVLESAGTVIESTQFYLNPRDSRPFDFTVHTQGDADYTLQYCQNPVWTVVRAMRGLSAAKGDYTSILASQMFSTLTALKINADNPTVGEVIRAWKANDSAALTSMLERNSELKTLLLEQTPWVQTARNQSLRMEMLTDAMDAGKANARLRQQTDKLAGLQNSDGGFRWASWSDNSSMWITGDVLVTMGIARSMGMTLNSRLTRMLRKAFNYYMTEAVRDIRPDDVNSEAAYIMNLYPDFELQNDAQQALVERTRARIAAGADRVSENVFDKAFDILILKDHNYESACDSLYRSIREYAVPSADTGTSFPSVNDVRGYATVIQAYKVMGASDADIDALRQWVLVRAQATDDLGAWNPDYVIAAVLMTGTAWTDVPVSDSVEINGTPFTPGRVEAASGYFAETLPVHGDINIRIKPNGVTPSYGSVISIARRTMATVAPRDGRDISIEKRFLVKRDGQWVTTTEFATGERVRVQLIIKALRDMEYVSVTDERAATLAPVEQLPGYVYARNLAFYRENLDASTRLAIQWLPKGTYTLSYDMTANNAGTFASGIATVQSQLAPELTAHSGGCTVTVR